VLFAVALVAFGVLHFVYGDFVTRVVTIWPAAIPARSLWVSMTGVLLATVGASVLGGWKPRLPLMLLAGTLAVSFLFLHLPAVLTDAVIANAWTKAGKALVLLGGCVSVAATFTERNTPGSAFLAGRWPVALGRTTLASFMMMASVQHVRWFEFVVSLVPAWVPGGGAFWTYAAAVFLLAGGLGMLIPATRMRAAQLSGVMIFLWVFMLHLPRALNAVGPASNEITSTFEALAFAGLAWVYAGAAGHDDQRRLSP
jgi:uncharacterized membrane protein